MTKEYAEAIAAMFTWLETRPDIPNFDAHGDVPLYWYDERVGVFKDVDGWWEYHPDVPLD